MSFLGRLWVVIAVFATGSRLVAGTIEGKTLDLAENAVGGITIQAFEVDERGNVSPVAFNSAVSDIAPATLGAYRLDLMDKPRVVLRLSGGGSNTISLPEPFVPNTNRGGAMSGRKNINDFDIIVPEAKPIVSYCKTCRLRRFGRR